jgi:hypothetical protein
MLFSPRFEAGGRLDFRHGIRFSQNGANTNDFAPLLQGKRLDFKAF